MSHLFNTVRQWLPLKFLLFTLVGLTGAGIHVITLGIFHQVVNLQFLWAQTIATWVAMTSNYLINNNLTYRDQRNSGRKLVSGLVSFYLVCSMGALISIQSANFLYNGQSNWMVAGVIGGISGSVWNYYFSSILTWKKNNPL
ncbi:MAG: GtrA family protein [Gammaproteobacteria bacterium]